MSRLFSNLSKQDEERLREAFGHGAEFESAAARAEAGEPIALITGEQAFFRESYLVTPDTLIPRPDTERVVEAVIAVLRGVAVLRNGAHFLDLCTGSGCIAISAAANTPARLSSVTAVDISSGAIAVARKNAARNRQKAVRPENFDVYRFIAADVTDKEAADEITRGRRFDVIAANPPYIKTSDLQSLDASVRDFEPLRALDGGEDGFRFYRAIIENFSPALSGGGAMIFEIGYDQREGITEIAEKYGFSCKVTRDWGGNDRVAELRRKLDI
ncbi:MAG: peptide chain release factor N(5)-glutamine methyltransferase [Eubacteriales bacterium]|jgi:release factor glutamine methyltransferase